MLRTELSGMIALAERLTTLGEHAVLATLFSSSGSTYRPLGSMMVSFVPSMIVGGVSGGCLEKYVARIGRSLTQQQPAALLRFDADPDGDNDGQPVLGCGGAIEVLVERLTPNHIEFLRQMNAARASDTRSMAACVIDASAQPSIAVSRFWFENGWYGKDDPQLEKLRQHCVAEKQSRHGVLDASGGRRALIHYIPPMTRLVVLGAGDDARPLCTLARSLGWHVTVADRRARLATPSRFPDADDVVADDWAIAVSKIDFTPHTAVIMMTHSLPDDIEILPLLSDKPMLYLGVLGPEHRRNWLLNAVAERTGLNDVFASRIHGPIGLNLGDRSAAGIAVSIVAEILACLNGRHARPLSHTALRSPARPRSEVSVSHA